ncbi:MAG TPA: hypothetical protein VFW78_00170 [Bacteroidia bacterium]|nr:hypothetical protein [Bacteroidia bacterium]
MEYAGTALYWFTDPLSVDLDKVRSVFSLRQTSLFAVYCRGVSDLTPVDSEALEELRFLLNQFNVSLIEMHDPCEHIIPSLARVLQADQVVLVDPEHCKCEPSRLEEVRFHLQMHSISFLKGFESRINVSDEKSVVTSRF